ncbi:MAG: outer membrane beta-barrel protein [Methylococcales bacterium]|nr:outer membrane beta-barrel protein [Methylococcales bacterium]
MFFNKLQVALLATLSMMSISAFAENAFYVAPFGSYLHTDGATKAHDGFGAGLAIGKELNTHFNVEVRGFWQSYDNDYSCCNKPNITMKGDSQLTGGTLDVQYFIMRDTFSPYVVAAVGGMNTDYRMQTTAFSKSVNYQKDTTSLIFETGVGTTYLVSDYFSLRGDVRYRLNTFPTNANSQETSVFNDLTVNFGFLVPL